MPSKVVTDFKALSLSQQHEDYPAITAVYNAAKEARRRELEEEIRSMGFVPGEVKKPPAAVKYRSLKDASRTWAGRGAEPAWLVEEMKETNKTRDDFRVK